MTKQEILAMKSGRELNMKVAEKVMGYQVILDKTFGDMERYVDGQGSSVYRPLQHYSEDMSAARQVLERVKALNLKVNPFGNGSGEFKDTRELTPQAICKAALIAVMEMDSD
jgi:hypothetical protein